MPLTSNTRGAMFALAAFGIYSTHDVVVKFLGEVYAPFQIVFFSTLFGFPIVTLMLLRDRMQGDLRPRHPWWTLLRTAAAVVSTTSAFYAFSVLPLAQTYALIFAAPLLITVLAVPVLGETVGLHRSIAVMVGLLGVLVVLRPGATEFSSGHLAALAAAVCSSVAAVVVRKIGAEERSAVLLLYPMVANILVMGCILPFVYKPMPGLHLGGVALMALLGFTAALCQIAAYRTGRAVVVAPMQYSQILWAVVYGAFFFHERPDWPTALGAGIIILSGIYVVFREDSRSSTRPVLRTESRYVSGIYPRISLLRRLARRDAD
ncbi:S-adenosylmethionine uptake transporter [Amaricoccus macauensis]|uniref:S-adenosylmethionine uptake transporter n=1 Tax=Amaricoccus macauensis TaxID=57001 RepID=A0A840STZ6_9RHOB|nr:S-adenosylmethionine uptake transporter [Amaricoccus macauensis]